jgi:two-component system, chemotaxis family, sensor kinase CheA
MNLPNATREDLVAVLLSDGFTTQNTASETSGRGVGMAAVHQSVAQLHGNVFVESERDKGTTWRFEFQQDYASN